MSTKKLSAAATCFALLSVTGCEAPGGYGQGYGYGPNATPASSGVVGGATLGDPLFSTNMNEYTPGGFIILSLNNATRGVMSFNLCRSEIERFDGGWRPVYPVSQTCAPEVRSLGPGQSTTFSFQFPPNLQQGQYRIRTNVGGFGRSALYTDSFVVRSSN